MMCNLRLSTLTTALVLSLFAASCGSPSKSTDSKNKVAQAGAQSQSAGPRTGLSEDFRAIPADSMFVFASLDSRAGLVPALVRFIKPILNASLAKELALADKENAKNLEIFSKLLSTEGLADSGIDPTPHFAMYTIDSAFVARVEIVDGVALKNFVIRSAKEVGESVSFTSKGNWEYWEYQEDDTYTVVAIGAHQVMVGVMRPSDRDRVLPMLIGDKLPERSIVDSGTLNAFAGRYPGQAIGYVNNLEVFDLLASTKVSQKSSIADMSGDCLSEIQSLVGVAPHLVFSFEQSSQDQFVFHMAVELRKDIARELKNVVAPVPAYTLVTKGGTAMTMGLGVKVEKAMLWIRKIANRIDKAPYRCAKLTDLNNMSASLGVLNMIPPVIGEISGFVVSLEEMKMDDPGTIVAMAAIESWNPKALLDLAKSSVPFPAIANLSLDENGTAVEISGEDFGIPQRVFLAMGPRMLGIGVGEVSTELTTLVRSEVNSRGPFLAMDYDYSKWDHLVEDDEDDDLGPEIQEAVKKTLKSLGPVGFSISATKFGIHSMSTVELK